MKFIDFASRLRRFDGPIRSPEQMRNERINKAHGDLFFKAWDTEFGLKGIS